MNNYKLKKTLIFLIKKETIYRTLTPAPARDAIDTLSYFNDTVNNQTRRVRIGTHTGRVCCSGLFSLITPGA
jgi:hypothetical protein